MMSPSRRVLAVSALTDFLTVMGLRADHLGVGQAALGADDVGLGVDLDLVVDDRGVDLGLEDGPAPLDVPGCSELLEQELEDVLGVAPQLVGDIDEVPEDGDLTLLEDVQLGDLEPLVVLDGLGACYLRPVEQCHVIVFIGHFYRLKLAIMVPFIKAWSVRPFRLALWMAMAGTYPSPFMGRGWFSSDNVGLTVSL